MVEAEEARAMNHYEGECPTCGRASFSPENVNKKYKLDGSIYKFCGKCRKDIKLCTCLADAQMKPIKRAMQSGQTILDEVVHHE